MQKLTYSAVLGTLADDGFKPLAVRAGISKNSMELVGDWKNGRRPRFRRLCISTAGALAFSVPASKTFKFDFDADAGITSGEPLVKTWQDKKNDIRLTDNFALFAWDTLDFEKRWDSILREAAKQDKRHV
jgi:hypothetical protein